MFNILLVMYLIGRAPTWWFGIFYIYDAPSVVVSHMHRYYALQLILGRARGFSSRPATILLLFIEVDRQNARPSEVLATERLVFFSEVYRERARQRYCSDQRGTQTELPAVESPHDREARLFQRRLIDGERERARQRPATHYRSVLSSGSFTAT